jgi:transposase
MKMDMTSLPDNPGQLKQIIAEMAFEQSRYIQENDLLREQIRLLYAKLFGKKSEKYVADGENPQLPLFDMPEPEAIEPEEEAVEVEAHRRQKRGRKPLPEDLPRVEVIHDIDENEKVCGCGAHLSKIGEDVSEKLDIIPAVIRVIRHIRPKYACRKCEGLETEGATVKIAPPPKQIIAKGIATAGLLAHILTAKFCDALPFYRQEKQFARLGAEVNRATMCNWAMHAAEACQPVLELLLREIRSGPLLNMDETTIQVLDEPGRAPTTKSYMWVCRGGPPGKQGVLYHYDPTRSSDVAKLLLQGYTGVVQTDGYPGYDFLDQKSGVMHAGCMAHARRKFDEAAKGLGKGKSGSAHVALNYIRQIYRIESVAKRDQLTPEELFAVRNEQERPILDELHLWLQEKARRLTPKSLMGVAVHYTLNQWKRLLVYLDHPEMTPDNNSAENAIRPFVIGRKNWLFSGNPQGAKASADIYSLIETAKANKLEPYHYLRYLFEKLPFAESQEEYEALLPMRLKPEDLALGEVVSGV